jgi:hypothetical protein
LGLSFHNTTTTTTTNTTTTTDNDDHNNQDHDDSWEALQDSPQPLLHVESIPRLLRLLNYHQDPTTGLFIMDRGYQTEALAEQTLELIWCALEHCPTPALLELEPNATTADCESMIYTLLGFVSRKRPIPQWDRAQNYYTKAIARGGSNICAALSYMTQLYWTRLGSATTDNLVDSSYTNTYDFDHDYYITQAQNQTIALCETCAVSNPLLVQQARQEYDKYPTLLQASLWPEVECIAAAAAAAAATSNTNPPTSGATVAPPTTFACILLLLGWFLYSMKPVCK